MDINELLLGLSEGAKGAFGAYSWMKNFQQQGRKLDLDQKKIELDAETKQLMAEIRADIARMQEGGKNDRWNTPSANVTTTQEGQNLRTADTNDTRAVIAGANNLSRETIAGNRDSTVRRGQDLNFTLGNTRNATTRYGIDTGAATTRRGQDVGAATTRRGQDINQSLGMSFETGRNTRATNTNALRKEEIDQRAKIEKDKLRADPWSGVSFGGTDTTKELTDGTGRPSALPVEVKDSTPIAPPAPRSPEAAGDQAQQLESQARALLTQFKAEADPAKKKALRTELERVRDQILKAQGKGGQ